MVVGSVVVVVLVPLVVIVGVGVMFVVVFLPENVIYKVVSVGDFFVCIVLEILMFSFLFMRVFICGCR